MSKSGDLLTLRKPLAEICSVPDRIISVYNLEQHVWAGSNSVEARVLRMPELQTIREFEIDPVRPFLNDLFRNIAAPYRPDHRDSPIGQGYWIQAEFGSGKSHLQCFVAALALGSKDAWQIVDEKEKAAGRGRRESLYQFWENGIEEKSAERGIFVVVKTLVGVGGGTVGTDDSGKRLTDYILDAAGEQLRIELGKSVSLYPTELLADRFLSRDVGLYRDALRTFLKDPAYFEPDEFMDLDDFLRDIQENKSPEYKRSCGDKLWRFYRERLGMTPEIPAETEDVLKNMVERILAEGYNGVVLVLDEVSLYMKNRDDSLRSDDEKTLVVLSNRLTRAHNLPIWTVCTAQQAIMSTIGAMNIIADDRLKLVRLLEHERDYYNIVLSRVRKIDDDAAIANYYRYYKRGFTWPASIGEDEFRHFFPFHRPAIEVLRAITFQLTTTRSAIHFMHQTLKHQIKAGGDELIRLWELFDEAVRYEEDPSGVQSGLVAIQTSRDSEYRAYEGAKLQIDEQTRGQLKVHREKAIRTLQTLFLYHIARTRQQGLTPEEIANSVLIERQTDATPDENIQHYEAIATNLGKELPQILEIADADGKTRYRFEPLVVGVIDPQREFRRARSEAESNEVMQREAWEHLLGLGVWQVKNRNVTQDLSYGVQSIFQQIAPSTSGSVRPAGVVTDTTIEVVWNGRQVNGLVGMRDLGRVSADNVPLPDIDTDQSDRDFAVFVGTKPTAPAIVAQLLERRKDPRLIVWTPDDLTAEEKDQLLDFTAYRKLISTWQGKDGDDAFAVVNWVATRLQTGIGRLAKIVADCYGRGRVDALNNTAMDVHVAGSLIGILTPLVGRVLNGAYESREISISPPVVFQKEDGPKVINGIVKTGQIPHGAKPNQDVSAARNFGYALKIIVPGAEKLNIGNNRFIDTIWNFVDDKLADEGQSMSLDTVYKNFMGINSSWDGKSYGLSRRILQIYLMCLVQQGKLKVGIGAKAGLSSPTIDYSNLATSDFSARVLDGLTTIQKVARPENWEALRPYAEKLLGKTLVSTHDDAQISAWRSELRQLFVTEKDQAVRADERARGLFELLRSDNPYREEVDQVARLFSTDLSSGNEIDLILHTMREVFGYQAYDSHSASTSEIDDLAICLTYVSALRTFLDYTDQIEIARVYGDVALPDSDVFATVRRAQVTVVEKLADIRPFVDSEVKLKTELVGHTPAEIGETGTLGRLIEEYTSVYVGLHDIVIGRVDETRKRIDALLASDDLRALQILERISGLQPSVSPALKTGLTDLADSLFICPSPSRGSVVDQLKRRTLHVCKLTFDSADGLLAAADRAANIAPQLLDDAFNQKLQIFLHPTIRERLRQGIAEELIGLLLECKTVTDIRSILIPACLADPSIVDTINRYLKRIIVKPVKLAEFRPALSTVEQHQLRDVAAEFLSYLEAQLKSVDDDDALPMLQFE